jgi:hypothetical protein
VRERERERERGERERERSRNFNNEAAYGQVELLHHRKKNVNYYFAFPYGTGW